MFTNIITTLGVIGTFLGIFVAIYLSKNSPSNYFDLSHHTYYNTDKYKRNTSSKNKIYNEIDDILNLVGNGISSIKYFGKIILALSLIFLIVTFLLMLFEIYGFLPSLYLKLMIHLGGSFSIALGLLSVFCVLYLPLKLMVFIYYDHELERKIEFFKLNGNKNLYWLKEKINNKSSFFKFGYPLTTVERVIRNKKAEPERDRILRKNKKLAEGDKKPFPNEKIALFGSWYFWLFVTLFVFNYLYISVRINPSLPAVPQSLTKVPELCHTGIEVIDAYNWDTNWRDTFANIYCNEEIEFETYNGFSILEHPSQTSSEWIYKPDSTVRVKGYVVIESKKYYFTNYSYNDFSGPPRLIAIY